MLSWGFMTLLSDGLVCNKKKNMQDKEKGGWVYGLPYRPHSWDGQKWFDKDFPVITHWHTYSLTDHTGTRISHGWGQNIIIGRQRTAGGHSQEVGRSQPCNCNISSGWKQIISLLIGRKQDLGPKHKKHDERVLLRMAMKKLLKYRPP